MSLTSQERERRKALRQLKKYKKTTGQDLALSILWGIKGEPTPLPLGQASSLPRVLSITYSLMDSEETDPRIKADLLKTYIQMGYGRPGEQDKEPPASKSPIMVVPPKISRKDWQAQYGPDRPSDEKEQ